MRTQLSQKRSARMLVTDVSSPGAIGREHTRDLHTARELGVRSGQRDIIQRASCAFSIRGQRNAAAEAGAAQRTQRMDRASSYDAVARESPVSHELNGEAKIAQASYSVAAIATRPFLA